MRGRARSYLLWGLGLWTSICLLALIAHSYFWYFDYRGRKVFQEHYIDYHRAGDVQGLMSLFWMEGVDSAWEPLIKMALRFEMQQDIQAIRIERLNPGDGFHYEIEGHFYGPNLKPIAKLHLILGGEERMHTTYLLGKKKGSYWIIGAREIL